MHFAQSKGPILTDVRKRIFDLDRAAPSELGKAYRHPDGLRGCLLGKNDVLMNDGQGLTDSELIKTSRVSNIFRAYQFIYEITRQTATMDFAAQMSRGGEDMGFREHFSLYMRTTGSQLQK